MKSNPRSLALLTSASAIALVVTAAPLEVRLRPAYGEPATAEALQCGLTPSKTIVSSPQFTAPTPSDGATATVEPGACKAAADLGLKSGMAYHSPLLLTLSRAQAKSGGGSGGGGSGGGGSGGGGSGGGGSGGHGSRGGSGVSGASSSSGAGGEGGGAGTDVFGGVEQVGPDLSSSQEAEAIGSGWK